MLFAPAFQLVLPAGEAEFDVPRVGNQRRRRRDLRHRAMERRVPARVVSRMTGPAGI